MKLSIFDIALGAWVVAVALKLLGLIAVTWSTIGIALGVIVGAWVVLVAFFMVLLVWMMGK